MMLNISIFQFIENITDWCDNDNLRLKFLTNFHIQ